MANKAKTKLQKMKDAAKELNEFLQLDPKIKIVGVKQADLEEKLKEVAELLEPGEEKELSKETFEVLKPYLESTTPEDDEDPEADFDGEEFDEFDEDPEELEDEFEASAEEVEIEVTEEDKDDEDLDDDEEIEEEPAPKKAPKKVAPKKATKKAAKKEKKTKEPTAYGTALEIMAEKPDTTKEQLLKQVAKKGIDVDLKKNAINTAYSQFRKVYSQLKATGLVK